MKRNQADPLTLFSSFLYRLLLFCFCFWGQPPHPPPSTNHRTGWVGENDATKSALGSSTGENCAPIFPTYFAHKPHNRKSRSGRSTWLGGQAFLLYALGGGQTMPLSFPPPGEPEPYHPLCMYSSLARLIGG